MKKLLPVILFLVISTAASAQYISCGSPFANFGLPVTFCGTVKSDSRDTLGKNSGTILYLCIPYPNQGMTIVIKDLDEPMFDYTLDEWIGKTVCASGIVQTYKGKYYIEIKKKSKLYVY